MEKKLFGYPSYDEKGEMILTTYDNAYSDMLMDIRMYKLKSGQSIAFFKNEEEVAVLLLSGKLEFECDEIKEVGSRSNVFDEGPYAIHAYKNHKITVKALEDSEILVQCTKNNNDSKSVFYTPENAPFRDVCKGVFGNCANRKVNTIFDHDIEPLSNMVLGEVINAPGNWSGYLPHRHIQPEAYLFKFDKEEGFGASFVGDHVFKSVNNSFAAIPGGELHPQAVAPGFKMYTCWMIRHLEGKPWLQTDRCEDPRYTWLHDVN